MIKGDGECSVHPGAKEKPILWNKEERTRGGGQPVTLPSLQFRGRLANGHGLDESFNCASSSDVPHPPLRSGGCPQVPQTPCTRHRPAQLSTRSSPFPSSACATPRSAQRPPGAPAAWKAGQSLAWLTSVTLGQCLGQRITHLHATGATPRSQPVGLSRA